jgi:DegV family protein with EDD domain
MIKIIADSTCDLPEDMLEHYDIETIPLKVSIAGKTYVDKSEISTNELFALIQKHNEMSVTSAPSPEQYRIAMEAAVKQGNSAIITTCSSGLSASYQSALVAAQMVDGKVDVVDTRTASLGSGMIALFAARLAAEGKAHDEIVQQSREKVSRQRTLLLVDTVEYLRRGGRISAVAARMAGIMGIKPIINVLKDGTNAVIHKARGYQKGMEWMLNYVLETARELKDQTIGIAYSSVEAPARKFKEMIERHVQVKEVLFCGLGSVVGTHVGPNAFGVFWDEK